MLTRVTGQFTWIPRMGEMSIGLCLITCCILLSITDYADSMTTTTTDKPDDDGEKDAVLKTSMAIGLGAGLGSFFVVVVCCCVIFKCCCKGDNNATSRNSGPSVSWKKNKK